MRKTHQMNSRQCEQKVGWRKNVAMNLWPFTWWTRLLIAPRRRFRKGWSLLFDRRLIIWFCWLVSTRKTMFKLQRSFTCDFEMSIFSPWDHRKSIFTCSFPDGSKSTQKSVCSCWLRAIKSSNVIVALALKTSSIGALWNTVMPNVLAFSTSWMNVSFQTGSNVFCLILERSVQSSK